MSDETVNTPMLVADVGGTNLNLALLAPEGKDFRLLHKTRCRTQEESSLAGPIRRFLAEHPGIHPGRACLCGAGSMVGGRLRLTNAPWDIDGPALSAELGLPLKVVNDFSALPAGTRHLDLADPTQVTPLPHGDDSLPLPDPRGLALVVGAGTGLGVGFLVPGPGGVRVYPSEGGHMGLPVFDEDSLALWRHLAEGIPGPPGAELAVSGPGLGRILGFLLDTRRIVPTPESLSVLALPEADRPGAISALADSDPPCGRALAVFVDLYARVCADLCAAFLPAGGLFLAGGATLKNADHFLRERRFMTRFERNYRFHLDRLARATPVFLAREYDLSLFGAAHAWSMA